jgi:DNA-directed RNA polymerase subunit RPC12/RpoP
MAVYVASVEYKCLKCGRKFKSLKELREHVC